MNFVQAMIVPTMASLGVGTLLVAQNLSLMEVSYAAPAAPVGAAGAVGAATAPVKPAGGAKAAGDGTDAAAGASPGPGALPMPADGDNSPEFGKGPDGTVIRAITDQELTIKAIESSGREDPFMALVPPDNITVPVPSISPQAEAELPPVPTPEPPTPPPVPKPIPVPTVPPIPTPKPSIDIAKLPLAGDKLPPPSEPQWLIRGIISTGLERVCLLEGKDEQVHARVGDKLSDGSLVEAISNRGVTFVRSGKRFVKDIGGTL